MKIDSSKIHAQMESRSSSNPDKSDPFEGPKGRPRVRLRFSAPKEPKEGAQVGAARKKQGGQVGGSDTS